MADGQETVLHRALPLLPNLPQSEEETQVSDNTFKEPVNRFTLTDGNRRGRPPRGLSRADF